MADIIMLPTASTNKTTQFKTVDYSITASAGTWYTALDIASGKGYLIRMSAMPSTGDVTNINIRVTVDGTLNTFDISSTMSSVRSLHDAVAIIDFITNIRFNVSLKIEAMMTPSSSYVIYFCADYSLE